MYVNSKKVGLKINMTKTEIMTNLVLGGSVRVGGKLVRKTTAYKYLGHDEICIRRDHQASELVRRIGLPLLSLKTFSNRYSQYV